MSGPQARMLPDGRRLHLNHGPIDLIVEAFGQPSEVERAYRKLISQYHPDKLGGAAPELQQQAEQQALERRAQAEQEAAALEQTAAVVTAAPVPQAAHVGGIVSTKTVDYEITDRAAFMRFALEKRPDLIDLWDADPAKMRALVKLQGLVTTMPGLRVFEKFGVTVR